MPAKKKPSKKPAIKAKPIAREKASSKYRGSDAADTSSSSDAGGRHVDNGTGSTSGTSKAGSIGYSQVSADGGKSHISKGGTWSALGTVSTK
mgnify:CR=1 FL=1